MPAIGLPAHCVDIEVDGQVTAVLSLVANRFGPLSGAVQQQIRAADPEALETMLHNLLDAGSLKALLDPPF
jgi:hypothetical protein